VIEVCKKNIFTKIKGNKLPVDSSLIKIYATTVEGARRIVLLFDEKIKAGYFLFFRKKDDLIGKNVSIKNPEFKKELHKYLDILDSDIEENMFEIIEL
jgi:hypothetical protein